MYVVVVAAGFISDYLMPYNRKYNVLCASLSKTFPYKSGRKEMFYLTTHSTHFIYGYMVSDI